MEPSHNYLYRRIKEHIREETKSLKSHDRLPSRTNLVKKYDVTRSTIDRAISELIGEGYLYSLDGSGTYIADNKSAESEDPKESRVINWGVIMPDIMHDAYPGILRGIEDAARENGINIFVGSSDNSETKQAEYIENQIRSGIKGLIIVPAVSEEIHLNPFQDLQKKNIPFVFCNRGIPGIRAPRVLSNNFYGGYIATRHLLSLGYQNIAFVSRPWYSASLERYEGYLSALHDGSIQPDKKYVLFEESWNIEKPGYESTKVIMQNEPQPEAIFCFNDAIAEGCYQALIDLGFQVGKDIGLMGYDDSSICERLPVKLSSVKFKKHEIGKKAAELLLRIMRGEDVQREETEILMPELVLRESCRIMT